MRPTSARLRLRILTGVALLAPTLMALVPPASVHGQSGDVVISQLYVGGGSAAAPLNADFVELFNRGADPVPLDGWSVQYASAKGTQWTPAALTGTPSLPVPMNRCSGVLPSAYSHHSPSKGPLIRA